MKKTTLIFLFLLMTSAIAEDRPLSKEEIELEREKLQLQRELIQLERERLEVERLKLSTPQAACPPSQTPAMAKKSSFTKDLYVGFDYVFRGTATRTATLNGTENETEGTASGYGIKLGFGTVDENRVEITYSRLSLAFEETYPDWEMAMLSLDYLFVYHEAFGEKLSPFITIGLASARGENIVNTLASMGYDVKGEKELGGTGFRFGFGLFYPVDEVMELSVGVVGSGIGWEKVSLTGSTSTEKLELYDSVSTTYLNINYRF